MQENGGSRMTGEERSGLDQEAAERLKQSFSDFYIREKDKSETSVEPDMEAWQSIANIPQNLRAHTPTGEQAHIDPRNIPDKMPYYGLSERDREILHTCVPAVVKELLKTFDGHLPKAVVIPETSGRVLAYLLIPIFEKISKQTGDQIPAIHFIKTPGWKVIGELEEDVIDNLAKFPCFRAIYLKDPATWSGEEDAKFIRELQEVTREYSLSAFEEEKFPDRIKIILGLRYQMRARAAEIMERNGLDVDQIAFIDESMVDGGTLYMMGDAFQAKVNEINFFPLLARKDLFKPFWLRSGERYLENVHPGMTGDNPEDLLFDYKIANQSHRVAGVEKSGQGMYSTGIIKNHNRYVEARNARDDLSALGEELSKTIYATSDLKEEPSEV